MGSEEKAMAVAQACMQEVVSRLMDVIAGITDTNMKNCLARNITILDVAMKLLEKQIGG